MKFFFVIAFIIFAQISYSQEKFEQKAFDYFLKNIITTDYPSVVKIKFSGVAEFSTSGSLFGAECFTKEENIFLIDNGFRSQKILIKIENNFKNIQKKGNEKLSMKIYQTLKINNKYIVTIRVSQKENGAFYYFIFDKDYEIKWCKSTFLI